MTNEMYWEMGKNPPVYQCCIHCSWECPCRYKGHEDACDKEYCYEGRRLLDINDQMGKKVY